MRSLDSAAHISSATSATAYRLDKEYNYKQTHNSLRRLHLEIANYQNAHEVLNVILDVFYFDFVPWLSSVGTTGLQVQTMSASYTAFSQSSTQRFKWIGATCELILTLGVFIAKIPRKIIVMNSKRSGKVFVQ